MALLMELLPEPEIVLLLGFLLGFLAGVLMMSVCYHRDVYIKRPMTEQEIPQMKRLFRDFDKVMKSYQEIMDTFRKQETRDER